MSALEDAVRAAMEEVTPGEPVVAWALVAATLPADPDADSNLTVLAADGQMSLTTAGLLMLALEHNVKGARGD